MRDTGSPQIVAIIGAECSGKTALAEALATALPGVAVSEALREFVVRRRRPPDPAEQWDVMTDQIQRESAAVRQAAAGGLRWVLSDSGALMTAVYSLVYYDDRSLLPAAVAHHRSYAMTVWCDIDIPWVADTGQRDGPQYRQAAHDLIGAIATSEGLEVVAVGGALAVRVDAVRGHLADRERS